MTTLSLLLSLMLLVLNVHCGGGVTTNAASKGVNHFDAVAKYEKEIYDFSSTTVKKLKNGGEISQAEITKMEKLANDFPNFFKSREDVSKKIRQSVEKTEKLDTGLKVVAGVGTGALALGGFAAFYANNQAKKRQKALEDDLRRLQQQVNSKTANIRPPQRF